jgi:hypothetical protein
MQDPVALLPYEIQIVNVVLIGIIKPYLAAIAIVLQLPIRRRSNDKMNRLILQLAHIAAIADDYGGV